ncbi:T9SS type A sorting domain-containing protein [Hymenobacter sp. HMF4947]|uniref:T9SS type A sorting domain-containing protein n=1 Tax=Hymenobacter ginkgonis TaxID=2682976 RepID=A0A7K1TIE8_9BACT|nr:T9SS type A sorting domain-containing protein [Hymenobacter ginkgonis]MVN78143.1 T9SS type A sorting domain-containing protein [Hymenobacter ginkgonis]
MKILLLRSAVALGLLGAALAPAHAQTVANGTFETWAARNGVESPTGWLTTDDVIAVTLGLALPTGSFTKTTDAHGGTYAARLETKTTLLGALPGAVGIGTKVGPNPAVPGGIPFTTRPAMLQFYYKLSGPQPAVASNGAFAQVALTRRVGGVLQTIATAQQVFTTVNTAYVLAQVPLTYTSGALPDSVRLVFSSGVISTSATAGTVFQVDDVSFTGTVTAVRSAALEAALSVYPNPSLGGRYVLAASPALLAAPLAVVDATGRVVRREAAPTALAATRPLDLTGLAGGIYTLQLFAEEGLVTKKLVVH